MIQKLINYKIHFPNLIFFEIFLCIMRFLKKLDFIEDIILIELNEVKKKLNWKILC